MTTTGGGNVVAGVADDTRPAGLDLRGRGFRYLWGSTVISSLGDGVRLTALPLLTLSLTHDPLLVSLVTVAGWAPLLLSALAGVWSDLVDRRALLVWVDTLRAVVVSVLAVCVLTHSVRLWVICVSALLLGIGEVVYAVCSQTLLPAVLDTPHLSAGNGRLYAAQVVFRDSVGQPLGGLLFVTMAAVPFFVDGTSFVLGILLVLAVPRTWPRHVRGARHDRWRTMMAEGFRYLWADRLLLTLASMLGTLNFFSAAIGAIEVLYVVDWLGLPRVLFGVMMVAGALGGLAGGMATGRVRDRIGTFPAMATALSGIGAAVLLLGLWRQPVAAGLAFAVLGFAIAVFQSLSVAYRQASVAPEVLGRVNGAFRLVGTGTAPFGALAAGALARATDVNVPFLVAGASILLLAVLMVRLVVRPSTGAPVENPAALGAP